MDDKSKIFDQLQVILNQVKSDLDKEGQKLQNLSPEDVSKLIKQYVPDEVTLSSILALTQNDEYSFEPLAVALSDDQDNSELLSKLQINPDNNPSIIQTLPLASYILGRFFWYKKPEFLENELTANDLNLTTMLDSPTFNLQGIYRIEQILSELQLGNFDVLFKGAHGVLCSASNSNQELDEISFTIDVTIRLQSLIDECRVYLKFITVSTPYKYEILDGDFMFYNDTCSSADGLELSIKGLSELKFAIIEESEVGGSVNVLNFEQFTMTGVLNQIREEVSLQAAARQAKIAHLFMQKVEDAIVEQHAQTALDIMTKFAKQAHKPPVNSDDVKTPTPSQAFVDMDNFSGLPS